MFILLWTIIAAFILTLAFIGIALVVSETRNEDRAEFGAAEGAYPQVDTERGE